MKFIVTPDDGFTINQVTINGEQVTLDEKGEIIVDDCKKEVSIEVIFEKSETPVGGCSSSIGACAFSLIGVFAITSYFLFVKKRNIV